MRSVVLLVPLLLAATLASLPPATAARCFSQLDDPIDDGGVTVCVDLGSTACTAWVSRETIYGRETVCLFAPPALP